jgi:hypothetical protein
MTEYLFIMVTFVVLGAILYAVGYSAGRSEGRSQILEEWTRWFKAHHKQE